MRLAAVEKPGSVPDIDAVVSVRGLGKTYGNVEALRGIDLDFPRGKLTSLLGPSGCGKTTLLKIIAGLVEPNAGTVTVDGKPVSGPGPERAFVFQDFALMPWATVLRNVAFGLELRGADKAVLGQTAAKLRALREPDPYKGKGIRYANEVVRKKVGKKAGAGAK